jgi:putative membrane protein
MNNLSSKNFNIDNLIKIIILLGYSTFFIMLAITDKIKMFVHPRITPYVLFCGIFMLIISLILTKDLFTPQRKKVNLKSYTFFLIPLFMAYFLPAKNIDSSELSYNGLEVATQTSESSTTDDEILDSMMDSEEELIDSELELVNNTIKVTDDTFVKWLEAISTNTDEYLHKNIELTGFVFKTDDFSDNEFVPARMLMTCCTADMTPIGLLANYNKTSQLEKDSWYKFKGKITMGEYQGSETPIINILSHEETSKPAEEYVYPY